MHDVTLARAEWAAVARELDATYREDAPPGLRARIAALLDDVPAAWSEERCTLALDAAAADVVRTIVQRGRGLDIEPDQQRQQGALLAEAVTIVREHQQQAGHVYRVEHRSRDQVIVVARTSAADAGQAELSELAARLMAAGATGQLVLVDETTGTEMARRLLWPESEPGISPPE